MSQQAIYQAWKPTVLNRVLNVDGGNPGQCSQAVLSYGLSLFPGVGWYTAFPPTPYTKDFGAKHNPVYFDWIANDHNNPNQVPEQGDVMVFGATPQAGYTNGFTNPYGHTGVCDSADASGYYLLQQNSPAQGQAVNVKFYAWKFRPCLGWLHPKLAGTAPAPTPVPKGQTVTLPAWVQSWAAYRPGSGLVKGSADQVGSLLPGKYGGLSYSVLQWVGDYAVNIKTESFGVVTIWVKNTDAVIN